MNLLLTKADLQANPNRIDWALRVARTRGDRIEIESGAIAETLGAWDFSEYGYMSLAEGVSLVIHDGAVLRLSPSAVRVPRKDPPATPFMHILFMGAESSISGNGTLDCNGAAHPGVTCSGPRAFGMVTVRNVCIIGLSGKKSGAEAFAFSAEGATGGTKIIGVSVAKCLSTGPDDYVSGIYVGGTIDNGIESLVEGCHVDLGPHGWFSYSSTFATRFSKCAGIAQRFWYTDSGPGIAIIRECSGQASYSAIGSVAVQAGKNRRHVVVVGSIFKALGEVSRGVEWWNKDANAMNEGGVTFINCTLEGFRWRAAVAANTGAISFINTLADSKEGDSIQPGGIVPFSTTIKIP